MGDDVAEEENLVGKRLLEPAKLLELPLFIFETAVSDAVRVELPLDDVEVDICTLGTVCMLD